MRLPIVPSQTEPTISDSNPFLSMLNSDSLGLPYEYEPSLLMF